MAGKTGIDAIFLALHHICGTLTRYRVKADALIDQAVTAGTISSAQATVAHDFLAAAATTCGIFELLAGFNSL